MSVRIGDMSLRKLVILIAFVSTVTFLFWSAWLAITVPIVSALLRWLIPS